jgi:hypothetical protein
VVALNWELESSVDSNNTLADGTTTNSQTYCEFIALQKMIFRGYYNQDYNECKRVYYRHRAVRVIDREMTVTFLTPGSRCVSMHNIDYILRHSLLIQ